MADLSAFPNRLDRKKCECCAIIETPKNRRNKFDYDPESNLFKLGGLLPEGMRTQVIKGLAWRQPQPP